MSVNQPPRVALIIETSVAYGRQILSGIAQYLGSHRPWSVFLEQRELGKHPPDWLASGQWDGILSRPTDPELVRVFHRMKVPVVDLNDLHDNLGLRWVGSDHAAIGRMGAAHLLERGYRHFAFAGFSNELWSAQRRDGFRNEVEKCGHSVAAFESPWRGNAAPRWDEDLDDIMRWLSKLPTTLALMTCNDARGLHVLDACSRLGLHVPDQVAVVGVDNEEILCDLSNPPLSSVQPDPKRIGYVAAELLDSLMIGKKPRMQRIMVQPAQVIARRSTEALAVDDAAVATAMRYIREHALQGCRVEDVVRHVCLSRSVLERRFRQHLKRSPQVEIRAVQLARVKHLLSETDFTLERIASDCGFDHPEYLSVLFKRVTGMPPGKYRGKHSRPSRRTESSQGSSGQGAEEFSASVRPHNAR
jgi:LacI family transcriptional regulator